MSSFFKSIGKTWQNLGFLPRIVVGIVIGAVLAIVCPGVTWIGMLGKVFVEALKAIAPLLVFVLVMSSLAQHEEGTETNVGEIVSLYILGMLMACLVAVTMNYAFLPTLVFTGGGQSVSAPGSVDEVLRNLFINMVTNPVKAIADGNYIGILFWAIVIGLALRKASAISKQVSREIADCISLVINWVVSCTPYGVIGLIFNALVEKGFSIFFIYGQLLCIIVGCMLIVALVANPILAFWKMKRNPFPLVFLCLKESGITAFFTRSSAANIPINMSICERLGLDKSTYSISIPLGATINMEGSAIKIAILSLAAANTLGITVEVPSALLLCVIATISACGTSGVPSGALLLLPLSCGLFGINTDIAMQVVATGFIIDVVQDAFGTALNSSADVLFTAAVDLGNRRTPKKKTTSGD
ncbi:MAG: serine/threonine transporter SstT [bacterium]|nr:serine/threonine transporter SstT [bacterium]